MRFNIMFAFSLEALPYDDGEVSAKVHVEEGLLDVVHLEPIVHGCS